MYQKNSNKEDMIVQFGQTWNLPLFNQPKDDKAVLASSFHLPNWIWNGNSIKAEVLNQLESKFQEDSVLYLQAMIALGGKATDNEVVAYFNDLIKWPPSTISARRNYWKAAPFYIIESFPGAKKVGPRGVSNTIWYVNFNNLYKILFEG